MCGIVGYSGNWTATELAHASERQQHRGPDGHGIFVTEAAGIGLAHVRLAILDTSSGGHQPMLALDGQVSIVFNGEIYNFYQLRKELIGLGHVFFGGSDTEVLLKLYIEFGCEMFAKLNGIFAVAIWDSRSEALVVSRDNFGVKPLYFAQTSRGFAFASEIKSLLGLTPELRAIDEIALHRYLSFLWCPGDSTLVQGVRKVPPGVFFIVKKGRVLVSRAWYQLPAFRGIAQDLSVEDAVAGTEHLLRAAVHRQLISDVPVGAFLSGGLDSSAVVAFAREQVPSIECFTIRNDGGQDAGFSDDFDYAQRVASHLGVQLHVVDVRARDIAEDLPSMVRQMDEPLVDTAPLNVLYISKLARQLGFKVLLSGTAGDDIFTGYRRHMALQSERLWSWVPKPVLRVMGSHAGKLDQRRALSRRVSKFLRTAPLSGDRRIADYFVWNIEANLHQIYDVNLSSRLKGLAATGPLLEFLDGIPTGVSPLTRMLSLEQRFFLGDFNLLFTDKMSMAAGVEVRVPFLDVELVDFAARIPDRFKQRGSCGKWVLKKAMEKHLPRQVIYRPKTGFGGPVRRWMRGEFSGLVREYLSPVSLQNRGLFKPNAVKDLIDRNQGGVTDAGYLLLSLICVEIWAREFLD